jgi:multiple sugar transport system permease protein
MAAEAGPSSMPERRRSHASSRGSERLTQVAIVAILMVGALAMIVPFVWMVTTSLSRQANVVMPRIPTLWPADPSLFNYEIAAANLPILRYYLNSFIVVGSTTLGYLFLSAITGYAFAKGRFPGKSILFVGFLATLLIPFETRMIPLYLFMNDLDVNDTYAALALPFLVGGFGTFFMRQAISAVPDELLDAARLDGAGEFMIFWRVVLPLCKAALASLAIIYILWRWNDLLWPLLVISDRDMYTVTQGLALAGRSQGVYTGVALATAVMAILPVMAVYLVLQRHIIRGIAMSGLKG